MLGAPPGGSGLTGQAGVDSRQSRPMTPVNSSCTPTIPPPSNGGRNVSPAARSAPDGAFQLALVHLGAALDALALGLVVELLLGASPRTRVRTESAAAARRDVV